MSEYEDVIQINFSEVLQKYVITTAILVYWQSLCPAIQSQKMQVVQVIMMLNMKSDRNKSMAPNGSFTGVMFVI